MTSGGRGTRGSQEAAYDVLRAAANDPKIRDDYRTIAGTFTDEDYRQIITLAWRYQFSDDRYAFKRELRELQQHVCSRVTLPDRESAK